MSKIDAFKVQVLITKCVCCNKLTYTKLETPIIYKTINYGEFRKLTGKDNGNKYKKV